MVKPGQNNTTQHSKHTHKKKKRKKKITTCDLLNNAIEAPGQ